ncbi:peptidase M23 [Corynebacterium sp. HMSC05D08]|uniref:GH25 family lysozyme n=1 Tax=Corynebacterium sp. HMSC05D08 TaxID=1581116 RepID=UPI0008A2529C|nr:GH25 family lysozyme [Corynebacterium sp. HMSC05D08]OFT64086.1 peptidase M23 [Corynebacterium sp. HMSC05D08]
MTTMPVNAGFVVTSPFGARWGTTHWGTDFGLAGGSGGHPIFAVREGTITRAGAASGFGQWITLDVDAEHGGGLFVYGHIIPEVGVGQRVSEGQRIGRINPDSNTNGGVAPHLHFEQHRYVWSQPGPDRLDPMTHALKGAVWPGQGKKKEDKMATLFGVDVSEHQDGMSLAAAKREGIEYAIIRTTDGTYKDRCYRSHLEDAESAGLITASYHYLRNPSEGTTVAQQVQASLEVMGDKKRPIWLDCETPAGLHVNHIREAKRLFEAAGVRVIGAYSYVPYWEGSIAPGEPDSHEFGAFWVAAYGQNRMGAPAAIYPGNGTSQWDYPLGNQKPALWQYGSNAQVAGYSVDINAYRGTRDQLRALFYGGKQHHEGEEMTTKFFTDFLTGYLGPQIDAIQEIWRQLRGPSGNGWPQLGQDSQGRNLTLVDAVASIRHQLAQIQSDLDELKGRK